VGVRLNLGVYQPRCTFAAAAAAAVAEIAAAAAAEKVPRVVQPAYRCSGNPLGALI